MRSDQFSSNSADIRAEACSWIAQLETGALTHADIEAFREWTNRSPRHASETRKLAHLSGDLNVLTEMAGPMKAAAAKYSDVVEGSSKSGWFALRTLSTAAVAAVLTAAIVFLRPFSTPATPEWPMVLSTGVGEYLEQPLPDGTLVSLNTDTELEVSYNKDRRQVVLLKGEALFTVARDTARPFVVNAGGKSVEALGTIFLVRNDTLSFEVAVTEGRIRLNNLPASIPGDVVDVAQLEGEKVATASPNDRPVELPAADLVPQLDSPLVLDAGQHISLSVVNTAIQPELPAIEAISPVEIRRKLAWRDGMLDFSDRPLEEVIREVSRYTTLKIEIADPELAGIRFGGVFRASDTEPLFRALESAYNIHAEYISADAVRLTRSDLE